MHAFLLLLTGCFLLSTPETAPEAAPVPVPEPGPTSIFDGVVWNTPDALTYREGSSDRGPEVSTWALGDKLRVGVDNANLRSRPNTEADVVAALPFGNWARVGEAGSAPEELLGRTNRWYRVQSSEASGKHEGFLYGSLLTPSYEEADLDGDGDRERVSVTFSPDFAPRVRVMEPGLPEGPDRVVSLDVEMGQIGGRRGGTVSLKLRTSAEVPWSLIEVSVCVGEDCEVRLLSYLDTGGPLGVLAPVQGDPKALTFVEGAIRFGARAPIQLPLGGRFRPHPSGACEDQIPFEAELGDIVAEVELASEGRGPDPDVTCRSIGTVSAGEHKGRTVISCPILMPGKAGPDFLVAERFLQEAPKRWVYVKSASSAFSRGGYTDLWELLREQGIEIARDRGLRFQGLTPEGLEDGKGWGSAYTFKSHSNEAFDRDAVEPLFHDPCLGAVYSGFEDGAFVVPQPEGQFYVYDYDWTAPAFPNLEGYSPRILDCSGNAEVMLNLAGEIDRAELRAVEREGHTLYAAPSDHNAIEDAFDLYEEYRENSYRQTTDAPAQSKAEFAKSNPLWFWRDPHQRLVVFRRDDLQVPANCEPVLYFYGTDASVRLTLPEEIEVMASAPRIDADHGWRVRATGDGGVVDLRTGRVFPSLFWEGRNGRFDPPVEGHVIAADEVQAYFRRVLPGEGLRGREIDEFIEVWAPILVKTPFVRVGFYERDRIDALFPMDLDPDPDTLIRVLMDHEPAEGPSDGLRIPVREPPPRKGFTVVEWGGIRR